MNMNILLFVLAGIVLVLTILLIFFAVSGNRKNSFMLLSDIHRRMSALESAAGNISEMGKDLALLDKILNAPKLRGNLGEYMLYSLLADVLPEANFEAQYRFKDGQAVDAVIKLGRNLIPVDSKFPMESFVRYVKALDSDSKKKGKAEFVKSVKARIDEISKKYIRTAEGTFDFAMMYIPSENVYYEILLHDRDRGFELFDYAMKNKVIVVSPNTFYTYLMTVVYGLRGYKIEQKAQEVMKELTGLKNELNDFSEELDVLGKHLRQAVVKFDEVDARHQKISGKVESFI